jgi:hypothetical protein
MKTISIALAVTALAGCSSDEQTPSLDIVAASAPVITSVATDDGFTQVRQNATVSLVIRNQLTGPQLDHRGPDASLARGQ